MITKILRNTNLGLIFLVAFIPLYVNNSLFFPFITGKAFAFRIIVEIMVALWVLLLLRDKKYAPRFSWISVLVTLFMVAVLVTDLAGLNPLRSIWSNFERMEGWITIVHLWAYFVVVTSMFGTGAEGRAMWHRFFNVSIVAAAIVGLYGFFQLFGWAEIHQGSSRIDASLGNAAYMAVYMLIHVFLALYMSMVVWVKKRRGLFWTYIILAVVFAYLLFETSTRGTILGLVGGGMLSLAIYAVFGKGQTKKSRWISGAVIAIIILLGVGLVSAKNTSFVKSHDTLNRLASISISDTKTQARGYIWPMAVKNVFSTPKTAILGVGQENFNYIFNANYNPKMWSQEQWFDRAHSVFLDWLVAGGLLGALLYLALFGIAIISLWRTQLTFAEKSLFTGLFVAYAIHNIFVFDNLASYVLFFSILGFTHFLSSGKAFAWLEKKDHQSENAIVVRDYIFLPVVVIAFAVTFYFVNVRPLQANTGLIAAMTSCSGGGTPNAELFDRALSLGQTVADQEIHEQVFSCSRAVILSGLPDALKERFYTLAKNAAEARIAASPEDARTYVIAGGFFNEIGDFKSATPLLEKAHELSPKKQSITYQLALNYVNIGKEKEAADLMKVAYDDATDNTDVAAIYASILVFLGRESQAQEVFAVHPEIVNNERILSAYVKVKKFDRVIAGYKALIEKDPKKVELYGRLAGAYIDSGRTDLAIALLQDMKLKFPEILQKINEAIKELQAGKK